MERMYIPKHISKYNYYYIKVSYVIFLRMANGNRTYVCGNG